MQLNTSTLFEGNR